MKIYTKKGDKGYTSLASGRRVSKTDSRLSAYGTADELNSFVGWLRCYGTEEEQTAQLVWIQNKLFNIGAALAEAEGEWISAADVRQLEDWIDRMQAEVTPCHQFILPGGNETVSLAHVCRTVTRRLERETVRIRRRGTKSEQNDEILIFLNRLSDFWFLFARKNEKNAGKSIFFWKK